MIPLGNGTAYVGLHWGCRLALALALLWHTGTAAVWVGAQTPNRSVWVQAGVGATGGQTFIYVERKTRLESHPTQQFAPWPLGLVAHARLEHRGRLWRAQIGSLRTRWLAIPDAVHARTLELHGDAHAGATVDGQVIKG